MRVSERRAGARGLREINFKKASDTSSPSSALRTAFCLSFFPLKICMCSVAARRWRIYVSAARQFAQWRGIQRKGEKGTKCRKKKHLALSKSRYKAHCLDASDLAFIKTRSCSLKQTIHLPSALRTIAKSSSYEKSEPPAHCTNLQGMPSGK